MAEAAAPSLASRITRDPPTATAAVSEASDFSSSTPADTDQLDGGVGSQGGTTTGLKEPEYDVDLKLADLQADPNNPLFSISKFEDLNLRQELLKGIYAMNFRKPSKIQEKALPLLLIDPPQNLIGQSQSGTGKTAAFSLNMLSRVDLSTQQPQALVLAPSRELARQIQGVIRDMGQFLPGLTPTIAVPDPSKRGQKYEGQIIVGTAGTVYELLRRKLLDSRGIKVLVLDEADNMLEEQGMGDQCKRVKQ